jgi:hypothetical protein
VETLWLHEGYGVGGAAAENSTGHQARLEWGASLATGDPFLQVESRTGGDRAGLHEAVRFQVMFVDEDLLIASDAAHTKVRDNGFCEAWVYRTNEYSGGQKNRYVDFQFPDCP